ncbi:MAG: anthranilate phosphoribosyltransferase [Verrucomicrobia bacterium]|nr:MAG: anthranilate phosphoribosyltransferase [Verrucomicrobiota bacterium]
MQALFDLLHSHAEIVADDAAAAVHWLADGAADAAKKERFLETLGTRGETAAELAAFAHALIALALDPAIDGALLNGPMLDVCGTGGDRLELFNISTASMFVLAAGGAVVVKHGNRAVTSQCGGADVLEALGVPIELSPRDLQEVVCRHGLGFIYAPAYHPAFAVIGPVRRALAKRGIPTIFNLLGPLLNPARPGHQLVGVYAPELLPKYAGALLKLGRKSAWVVHGSGADELTTAGQGVGFAVNRDEVREFTVNPSELGLAYAPVESLRGGDKKTNAHMLESVLNGTLNGPCLDAVLLNSAAGFVVAGLAPDLATGLEIGREAVAGGAALAKLNALRTAPR